MTNDTTLLVRNVGFCLKQIRLGKRLRLEDVSTETTIHKHAIRRTENGTKNFNISSVVPLIKYYKVSYTSVIKDYERLPTRAEWKELARLQKENNNYHKSKKRLKPNVGVQLELKF